MGLTKIVNGVRVEMTPEEETAFLAQQQIDSDNIALEKIRRSARRKLADYKDEAIDLLIRQATGENVQPEINQLASQIAIEKAKLQ